MSEALLINPTEAMHATIDRSTASASSAVAMADAWTGLTQALG